MRVRQAGYSRPPLFFSVRSNSGTIPGERNVGKFFTVHHALGKDGIYPFLTLHIFLAVTLIGPNHIASIVVIWAVLRLGGVMLHACHLLCTQFQPNPQGKRY